MLRTPLPPLRTRSPRRLRHLLDFAPTVCQPWRELTELLQMVSLRPGATVQPAGLKSNTHYFLLGPGFDSVCARRCHCRQPDQSTSLRYPFLRPIDTVCGGGGGSLTSEERTLRILRACNHDRYFSLCIFPKIDHEDCSRSCYGCGKSFLILAFCSLYEYGLGSWLDFSVCGCGCLLLHGKGKIPRPWALLVFDILFCLPECDKMEYYKIENTWRMDV